MFLAIVAAFVIDPVNLILSWILGATIKARAVLAAAATTLGLGIAGLKHLLVPYSTLSGFESAAASVLAALIACFVFYAIATYFRQRRNGGDAKPQSEDGVAN